MIQIEAAKKIIEQKGDCCNPDFIMCYNCPALGHTGDGFSFCRVATCFRSNKKVKWFKRWIEKQEAPDDKR